MVGPHGTVLVVEDNEDHALLLRLAFARASPGVTLRVAEDGGAAVAYLRGDAPYGDRSIHPWPDLVLLDANLPERSELDVLRWTRKAAVPGLRELPIVMLSASADDERVREALRLGARAWLVKPTRFEELVAEMDALAGRWLPGHETPDEDDRPGRSGTGRPA